MRIALVLAALAAAGPAAAQARYLPQADTLWYESVNPHRMYVVRGADTLGQAVRPLAVVEVMLLEKDGTLLYVERIEPGRGVRRPPPGSARGRRVSALVRAVARRLESEDGPGVPEMD